MEKGGMGEAERGGGKKERIDERETQTQRYFPAFPGWQTEALKEGKKKKTVES